MGGIMFDKHLLFFYSFYCLSNNSTDVYVQDGYNSL